MDNVLTPYGAYQALLISSPYYAAYSLPLAYVAPSVDASAATPSTTTTSTAKPATADDIEVAKEPEEEDTIETLQKLRSNTQTDDDLKSDARLRAAVSRINTDYVIEEIVAVPGKHVLSSSSQVTAGARSAKQQLKKATAAKLGKGSGKLRSPPVNVEATGRTSSSSSSNFPQIPFGSYFLPYSPIRAQAIQGRKQAALILEPHSKAVVGNGGTAISTPISKALLKKGVPTNVYFNPESVAIAGVGGKAHAAADLELDFLSAVANDIPISTSGSNFNRIQEAAARLVAIQELAKRKGAFSEEDNKVYANSLLELGQAATALALLQQNGQIKDFSVLLQPELFGAPQKQPSNLGLEANNPAEQKIDDHKHEEVTEQQLSPEDILPPNDDHFEDVNDSVAVLTPKKDAAVAEAKPVGLSIAGEGGVASSKPNAVALSGRNGLAVASPKATAIAGVTPEEAAAFSITLPSRNQLVIKTPNSAGDDYDYGDVPLAVSSFPRVRETPQRADALVDKWRVAIAEEYAARSRQTQTQPKLVIRAAPKRRLHHE
ncbi:uncharacterized protein Dvir_GJ13339 [Drosophila virilis]|uniref:DUF4774 domain-containing protein n=1 Tax=Drosophila virilis TaxID=7244 RepID=B4LHP4_DROVI|nr:uncharacterized protein Dvir_GJ13339 [Drosophila virilis]